MTVNFKVSVILVVLESLNNVEVASCLTYPIVVLALENISVILHVSKLLKSKLVAEEELSSYFIVVTLLVLSLFNPLVYVGLVLVNIHTISVTLDISNNSTLICFSITRVKHPTYIKLLNPNI